MGATNALDAFRRYGGKVPATSLAVLLYMALVSKDRDDWPYYRQGQHAIAEFALGRSNPCDADLRAVQRAMKPLLDIGAVTVERAGAARSDGNVTARYRLNLHDRADKARREWEQTPDGKRRVSDRRRDPQHPTESGGDTRRKVTRHPTVSDDTPDGNRRAKETGGDMRSEKTKEEGSFKTASHPPRAIAPSHQEPAPVVALFPGTANAPGEIPYRPTAPRLGRRDAITEALAAASARRAKAVADHKARTEAAPAEEIS